MLRKIIAAAALAASAVAIMPSAALAQDRGHASYQARHSYAGGHEGGRISQDRHGATRYVNRADHSYRGYDGHNVRSRHGYFQQRGHDRDYRRH